MHISRYKFLGLALLIATLTTGCCCHDRCKKPQIVPKPKAIEVAPEIPEPEPEPEVLLPEPPPPAEIVPDGPNGELIRMPYDSIEIDIVLPFTEMCFLPEEGVEEEEEKIDWGFITPWLYKDQ